VRTLVAEGHPDVTLEEVLEVFKRFGPVGYARLMRNSEKKVTGNAIVEFNTAEAAQG
jgi:RNA recognition motif-containing protein